MCRAFGVHFFWPTLYIGLYPQTKSVQLNFLLGKNNIRTAIEHEYWSFIPLPQKIIPPPQKKKFLAMYAPVYISKFARLRAVSWRQHGSSIEMSKTHTRPIHFCLFIPINWINVQAVTADSWNKLSDVVFTLMTFSASQLLEVYCTSFGHLIVIRQHFINRLMVTPRIR